MTKMAVQTVIVQKKTGQQVAAEKGFSCRNFLATCKLNSAAKFIPALMLMTLILEQFVRNLHIHNQLAQLWLTSEEEEQEGHEEGVAKVEESADEAFNLEFGHVEVEAVEKEVDGSEATGHERTPPPVIVLENNDKKINHTDQTVNTH